MMMNAEKWAQLSEAVGNNRVILDGKVETGRVKSKYELYLAEPQKFCVTMLQPSNISMSCIRINLEDERYSSWFNRFVAKEKYVFIYEGEKYLLKAHSQTKGRFDGCAKLFKKIGAKFRDKIVLINNFDGTYGIEVLVSGA